VIGLVGGVRRRSPTAGNLDQHSWHEQEAPRVQRCALRQRVQHFHSKHRAPVPLAERAGEQQRWELHSDGCQCTRTLPESQTPTTTQ